MKVPGKSQTLPGMGILWHDDSGIEVQLSLIGLHLKDQQILLPGINEIGKSRRHLCQPLLLLDPGDLILSNLTAGIYRTDLIGQRLYLITISGNGHGKVSVLL